MNDPDFPKQKGIQHSLKRPTENPGGEHSIYLVDKNLSVRHNWVPQFVKLKQNIMIDVL